MGVYSPAASMLMKAAVSGQGEAKMRQPGSGYRVWRLGFRVWGLGFRVLGSWFRVQGSGFRV